MPRPPGRPTERQTCDCGALITQSARGRPARYCSAQCRKAASYRRRGPNPPLKPGPCACGKDRAVAATGYVYVYCQGLWCPVTKPREVVLAIRRDWYRRCRA